MKKLIVSFLSAAICYSANAKIVDEVQLNISAFATLEETYEFEDSALVWEEESDEFNRVLKGEYLLKNGKTAYLGPISIKLEKNQITVRYGYYSQNSVSLTENCDKNCSTNLFFSYDDGDYPIGGEVLIEWFESK